MSNQVWESWRDYRLQNFKQERDEVLAVLKRIINRATAPMSDGDILLSDIDDALAVIKKVEQND